MTNFFGPIVDIPEPKEEKKKISTSSKEKKNREKSKKSICDDSDPNVIESRKDSILE